MKHLCTSILIGLLTSLTLNISAQRTELLVNSGEAINKGIEAHDKGEYEKAIEQYNLVFEGDTNYVFALYEKALSLNANKQYDKTIKTGELALTFPDNDYELEFYNLLNSAYDEKKEHQKALDIIDKGLERFPNAHVLHYNKGFTFETLNKYEEAFASYQKAIELNPKHFNSHFKIGELAANMGDYTKAIFALSTALVFGPNHRNNLSALIMLDEVLSLTYEGKEIEVDLGGDDFEDINQIIESKIAIDDKYKTGSSIKFGLVNQIHAMFELLTDQPDNKSWFAQTYLPFFLSVKNEKQFKPFSEYLFASSTNEGVQKKLMKNIKDLKVFGEWVDTKVVNLNCIIVKEGKELTQLLHENGRVAAIGEREGTINVGFWKYYNAYSGNLTAEGEFDKKGKQGEWVYYHDNRKIREKTAYKDGKAEGTFFYFGNEGNLLREGTYKDDKKQGLYTYYDIYGCKDVEEFYEAGVLNGPFTTYHKNGEAKVKGNFKNDVLDGKYIRYYEDGTVEEESAYENGKFDGASVEYYNNGNKYGEYTYVDGVLNGDYKLYYKTGELSYSCKYVKGNESGVAKNYYKDGTVSSEGNYDETGKKNGIEQTFNKAGKKTYEEVYKKGEIVAYQYFDEEGNILSEGKKKNKQFFVDSRRPDNIKTAEGNYAIGDKGKVGIWKYYSDYGQLESEMEYKDGQLKGLYKEYNSLGEISTESKLVKDNPFTEWITNYYLNGEIASNGWKVNDQYQGKWEYFYRNGKLASTNVYLDNENNGPFYYYDINGKLSQKDNYIFGQLVERIIYDTLGKVIQTLDFKKNKPTEFVEKGNFGNKLASYTKVANWYTESYKKYHGNGQLAIEGNYLNNKEDGKWEYFVSDGFLTNERNFEKGKLEGDLIYYHPEEATISSKSNYSNNKLQGEYASYSVQQKIINKINYEDGIREGATEFFDPNGVLQMVRYYKNGKVIGYSYTGADGKLVEMIPLPADGTASIETKFSNGKVARIYSTVQNQFDGILKEFYESGQLSESSTYKMGIRHGLFQEFADDGTLLDESTYEYDVLQGPSKTFYANGQLKKELNFVDGVLHGEALFFDENGNETLKKVYYNDNLIEEIKY